MSFDNSLKQAYEQGYLETGNNDDMEGLDLLRKINILSSISYHHFFNEKDCYVNSLNKLTSTFLNFVKTKNMIVKYIGESIILNDKVSIRVEPVILSKNDFYSNINYEQNIVEFKGDTFDHLAFLGIGAGRYPTASVVYNDLIQIKNNNTSRFSFTNSDLTIDNDIKKCKYLVLSNDTFEVSDKITISELNNRYQNIVCYARIEGDFNV
jgi:homoserine dehydrogenase